MNAITHLNLFSGIGGFAVGFRWARERLGFSGRTIAFCEIDDYAQRILIKNFGAIMADSRCEHGQAARPESDQNQFRTDIHLERCDQNVANAGRPRRECGRTGSGQAPRIFTDIRSLDGAQFRGVTVLSAGVPCAPASCAGKRRGTADDRWIWPEALRILREAMPTYAIVENPPGILSLEQGMVFERLLAEMESHGYAVQPIIIPACAVDARHRRDRVWIVANRTQPLLDETRDTGAQRLDESANGDKFVPNPGRELLEGRCGEPAQGTTQWQSECGVCRTFDGVSKRMDGIARWPEEDPTVPRVAKGVKDRVDRLKGLGNAIVPQVAQQIFEMIYGSLT